MGIGSAALPAAPDAREGASNVTDRCTGASLQVRAMIWMASGVAAWVSVAGLVIGVASVARALAGQA